VDIALWDIKGKALGVPVYELLGGLVNERVRAYANSWFVGANTPEEFAELAAATVEQGFTALKWDPFGKAYLNLSTAELNAAIENVAAVREAVGPDVDLIIEGHGRFNVMTSKAIGWELVPLKPYWFEEPVHPGRVDALAQVRKAVPIPISAGERSYSRFDCADLLAAKAVDVIQADVIHIGGLTELKRATVLADAAYVPVSPHNPNGPICHAATLHMAAACHNFSILETMVTDVPWRKDITDEQWHFENGYFKVPSTPGLGIELNEDNLAKYPYEARDLRHYDGRLTNIRPPDACRWF
jgi:galactonate dehydratase